jgi:hypothetical protein
MTSKVVSCKLYNYKPGMFAYPGLEQKMIKKLLRANNHFEKRTPAVNFKCLKIFKTNGSPIFLSTSRYISRKKCHTKKL